MIVFTCTKKAQQDYSQKKRFADTKNILCSHNFIEKEKLRNYLSGMLSVDTDEAELERNNLFINDISNFNK